MCNRRSFLMNKLGFVVFLAASAGRARGDSQRRRPAAVHRERPRDDRGAGRLPPADPRRMGTRRPDDGRRRRAVDWRVCDARAERRARGPRARDAAALRERLHRQASLGHDGHLVLRPHPDHAGQPAPAMSAAPPPFNNPRPMPQVIMPNVVIDDDGEPNGIMPPGAVPQPQQFPGQPARCSQVCSRASRCRR